MDKTGSLASSATSPPPTGVEYRFIESVPYRYTSSATMALGQPSATRTAVPPFLGMAQMLKPSRCCSLGQPFQNSWVELMARSRLQKTQSGEPLVPSFGASTITSDWNSAVTRASDCTVSWQVVEVPLQAPPQPKNRAPPAGEAVSVTWLPVATMTSQVDDDSPQFSPPPVTVPGPVVEAARCACAGGGGCATKFAYTVASLERVIVQPPDPLQSVPQLSKPYPLLAAAVSVTVVPSVKSALHWEESQSRPEGDDVTRPFPCTTTVRRCLPTGGGGATAKVALTSRSASNFRSHPAAPLHAPPQPTN